MEGIMVVDNFGAIVADADYSSFFEDTEFHATFPGIHLPPPSFISSGARIVSFRSGDYILLAFPVQLHQMNPIGTLQGGILCSFFDDAFGCLSFASLKRPCVSISMSVNFIRASRPGDSVLIRAEFKSKGRDVLQLSAEAENGKGRMIATAISSLSIMLNKAE